MKSITHHSVAAQQSRYANAGLHRSKPFALLLICLFLAVGIQAQPFNQSSLLPGTDPNPLKTLDAGSRSVPVFVDIDNDCDKDCFVGNQDGDVRYYKNTGTASAPVFTVQLSSANPMNGFNVGSNAKPAFVDLDADGDLDCFVGAGDGTVHTYKNTGTVSAPVFDEMTGSNIFLFDGNPFDGVDVGSNASPGFLDVDSDGDFDCFIGRSNSSSSIRYFRNEGDDVMPDLNELLGGNNPLSNVSVGANGNINSNACLTFVDLDSDGDFDCYVGISVGTFRYFSNAGGDFTYVAPPADPLNSPTAKDISASTTDYAAPAFVDIDADGDQDCFSGRNNGMFVYYRNDATVTARTITCSASYVVDLTTNGTVSVNPATVDVDDLYVSSTFSCPAELVYAVSSTPSTLNFTCSDATNTATSNGTSTASYLTLQATDAAGSTATCSVNITVVDKTAPDPDVLALPVVTLDICSTGDFPGDYTPTATDACALTIINGVSPLAALPPSTGVQVVIWTYVDDHGNVSSQTQTFSVVSNVAPTFASCPAPIFQPADPVTCGFQGVAFTEPQVDEDCESITLNSSHTATSFFPVGPTNVTYAATDAGGNTGYCNFTVMVQDNVAPTVTTSSCPPPPDGPLSNDQGLCGATYSWTAPGYQATDNCGGAVNVSANFSSGTVFPIGSTTVVYTATDVSGNTTTFCPFTVTVNDAQSPSMTCPVSTAINTAPGTCVANVNVVRPPATDNCSVSVTETDAMGASIVTTLPRTQTLAPGQTTFYFRASDPASNSVSCSYTITVVDNEKPKFTGCPSNVNMQADNNGCTKSVSWTTPTVTDNCTAYPPENTYTAVVTGWTAGTVTSTSGTSNTLLFNEGLSTVTYTVSDQATAPNTQTCSFTVRVTNTNAPTITCPVPVTVNAGNSCLYTLAASNLTGVTSTAPASCDPGTISYFNSAGAPLSVGSSTFGLGTYTLTARATDVSSNTSNCTFTLQVVDRTAPALVSCPPNITVNSAAALCGANPTWIAPVYSDNCSSSITVTKSTMPAPGTPNTAVVLSNNSGGFFPVGTTTVNFVAKDAPASTYLNVSCSVVVTVNDNVPPQFTNCPASTIVLNTSLAACTTSYSLLTPVVTDNCPTTSSATPAYTVTYTLSGATTASATPYSNGPLSLNLGNTTVVYTAVDNAPASNSAVCSYTVRVEDQTAPAISCPPNQNIVATSGCSATSAAWSDATASDNCSVTSITGPLVISGPTPLSITGSSAARTGVFQTGITVLGYTASDNAANTAACTFMIFVKENVAPTITCPSPITVSTDANSCTRTLTPNLPGLGSATASDNCNVVSIANTLQQTAPVVSAGGSYTVTYTATDASGNTAACTQNISVLDLVKPVITCSSQPYTFISSNGNSCVENGNTGTPPAPGFNPPTPSATDNCSGVLTAVRTPGQPGQYCVNTTQYLQWQATDGAGNLSTCSQQIIILTNIPPPTIQCPAAITVNTNAGSCVATNVNLGTPIVTPAGITATNNASGTYPVGNTTVTWTATNAGGTTSCQQVVTVNVNPANVEVCGNGIDDDCNPSTSDICPCTPTTAQFAGCNAGTPVTLNDAPGCPASVTVTPATFGLSASDNCGNTVTITPASTILNATGVPQNVTFTATVGQNSVTCVKSVTVVPAIEVCANGIDDDCDGLTDAADPDCGGGSACAVVKRLAGDGAANDYYGNSVDVHNDLAVVGAYYDDNPGINSGSVYVLDRGASNTWLQVAKLSPMDGTSSAGDWFGYSVAIDGDYIVVGASEEGSNGAAYVFKKGASSSSWTQVARLVDATGAAGDKFGFSVSISGDYIIVGAPQDETTANINDNHGSVSVFQRSGTVWSFVVKRTASDALPGDVYGSSVSIEGDYAAVGAPLNDYTSRINAGSVYVLHKGATNTWTEIAQQHASDYLAYDNYGTSVSLSGSNLLVGSPQNDVSGKANAGSVYILNQDEGGADVWGEQDNLIASDFTAADQFGISVSLDGDVAAIGAHFDDIRGFHSGSTYLFDGSGGWIESGKVDDVTGGVDDNFGRSVGISGSTVIVGSWKDNNGSTADQGSALVFDDCSTLFQAPLDDRSETPATLAVPAGKVLCAPNPATDIINIDVTLVQEEAVRITVCDATGRLLETVFNDKTGVESRFQWDGGRYGRGVYFIRVQSASVNKVVSVTILR